MGAGKSAILSFLAEKPKTKVMLADEIAHKLMEPGTDCYQKIIKKFNGWDIFADSDMQISEEAMTKERAFDRKKLAQLIFSDEKRRQEMNDIVHPAVKEYVKKQYRTEQKKGETELLVLEAALLIEEEYGEICDELWYIYTSEENRRKRLKESRGYSEEKIKQIFQSQLSEEEFKASTQVTIDNNGNLEETMKQIEKALRRKADE